MKKFTKISLCAVAAIVVIAAYIGIQEAEEKEDI